MATPCSVTPVVQQCNLLCNTDFECPIVFPGSTEQVSKAQVPCWDTTQATIEIWTNNSNIAGPTLAYSGTQWVELNSTTVAPFFQVFTVPVGGLTGSTLSFAHAGRSGCVGVGANTMQVTIRTGSGASGPIVYTSPVYDASTPVKVWNLHTANLPVLAAGIHTLVFESLGGGACGNFLDAISVYSGPLPTVDQPDNVIICHDEIVSEENFTSTPTGATFTWSNDNTAIGLGASGTGNVPVFTATNLTSNPITATITVIATLDSCPGPETTYTITVNPLPNVLANSNSPVNPGDDISLSSSVFGGTGPFTYSWTGPNGFTSGSQNAINTSVTEADEGNYIVTITDTATGCSKTTPTFVTVNPCNITVLAVSNTPVTEGDTILLGASNVPGATNYSWTGPNLTVPETNQNPSILNAVPGIYTYEVTVMDTDGCTATDTVEVTVEPAPCSISVIASSNSPVETGGTLNLTANTTGGTPGFSYSWSFNGGIPFSSLQNPSIPNATTANSGTYTVVVTDIDDCTATHSTPVTVNSCNISVIATGNTPVTVGANIQLSATSVGATNYTWVGLDDGFTSNVQTPPPFPTPSSEGFYSYTVTVTNIAGCQASDTIIIEVVGCDLNVTATANDPVSIGETLQLTATPSGGDSPFTYFWIGPLGFTSTDQNPALVTTQAMAESTGCYTVTVTDTNDCIASDEICVTIIPSPCYLVTDCIPEIDGGQAPYLTSTNLSGYVNKIIKFCLGTLPTVSNILPPANFVGPTPTCYRLTKCCIIEGDPEPQILINVNPAQPFVNYSGSVINFPNLVPYEGICWTVSPSLCPDGPPPANFVGIDWDNEAYNLYAGDTSCADCQNDLGQPCTVPITYVLFTDRCTGDTVIVGGGDYLSNNIGFTVVNNTIPELIDICWLVSEIPKGTDTSGAIIITVDDYLPHPRNISTDCPTCVTGWPDGCYCATITLATTCVGQQPWLGEISQVFDTCELCAPTCYLLTDCSGVKPDIIASNNFSDFVGLVVKLENCGDTCWSVEIADDCVGSICVPLVTLNFTTCEACLPVVLPIPPIELHPRRVKPGYYTLGCPPEYTERIYCTFAEAVFDEMAKARYGIDVCCDEDVDKWDIKKQELDLRALYDPEVCKSTLPVCCDPDPCPVIVIVPVIDLCPSPSDATITFILPVCITGVGATLPLTPIVPGPEPGTESNINLNIEDILSISMSLDPGTITLLDVATYINTGSLPVGASGTRNIVVPGMTATVSGDSIILFMPYPDGVGYIGKLFSFAISTPEYLDSVNGSLVETQSCE